MIPVKAVQEAKALDAIDVNVEGKATPVRAVQPEKRLLESSLTRDAVRRGLDSLPPDYKQILLLREIQGLSYEEIAAALGIESGTVKSRIFRARKRLCTFLIEDGNIPEFRSSGKMKGGEKQ